MARKIAECGTRSGYNKHCRLKEEPCLQCKEAHRIYKLERYKNNPEYRKRVLGNINKRHKQRMVTDPEYARKQKIRFHALYASRYKGVSPYTEPDVINTYGSLCHICGKDIDLMANRKTGKQGWENSLHIDHLIPVAKGGLDILENVRPSHGKCNLMKGAR